MNKYLVIVTYKNNGHPVTETDIQYATSREEALMKFMEESNEVDIADFNDTYDQYVKENNVSYLRAIFMNELQSSFVENLQVFITYKNGRYIKGFIYPIPVMKKGVPHYLFFAMDNDNTPETLARRIMAMINKEEDKWSHIEDSAFLVDCDKVFIDPSLKFN